MPQNLNVFAGLDPAFCRRIDAEGDREKLWQAFDHLTELTLELGQDPDEVHQLSLKQRYILKRLLGRAEG